MKKFWKGLATALCALAISGLVFSGCSDGGDNNKGVTTGDSGNGDGATIALSQSAVTLQPGVTVNLTLNNNGTPITSGVTWASDDPTVATVSASETCVATVTPKEGVSSGSTDIIATYESKEYKATVTISDISLPITLELTADFVQDEFGALSPSQTKETYTDSGLYTWDTANAEVRTTTGMYALANASGFIKNPREGDNFILYYYGSGESTAAAVGQTLQAAGLKSYLAFSAAQVKTEKTSVKLTINAHGVDYDHDTDNTASGKFGTIGIIDSENNKVLAISETLTATATDYTFYVKPTTRLIITNVGKDGTSISFNKITLEASDDAVTADGTVAATGVTLQDANGNAITTWSKTAGNTIEVTAVLAPDTTTETSVTWASSDAEKVSVTPNETNPLKATVCAIAATAADTPVLITATAKDTSVQATLSVTVTEATNPISDLTLSAATLVIDLAGDASKTDSTIYATIVPTNTDAPCDTTEITWSVADDAAAYLAVTPTTTESGADHTVTLTGTLPTGISKEITLTAKAGSKEKTVTVTVKDSTLLVNGQIPQSPSWTTTTSAGDENISFANAASYKAAQFNHYTNHFYAGETYTSLRNNAWLEVKKEAFAEADGTVKLTINAKQANNKSQIGLGANGVVLALSPVLSNSATDVSFLLSAETLKANDLQIFTVDNSVTGDGSKWYIYSIKAKTSTETLDTTAPTKPEVTATAGAEKVTLSWAHTSDSDVTAYIIAYAADKTVKVSPANAQDGTISVDVTGLTAGTEYSFTVKAYDVYGNQAASDAVTATPTADTKTWSDYAAENKKWQGFSESNITTWIAWDNMIVNATAGKLSSNGATNSQVNATTVFYVPVTGNCTITVCMYGNNNISQFDIKGGGESLTQESGSSSQNYQYKYAYNGSGHVAGSEITTAGYSGTVEADGKYAVITIATNDYLMYIDRTYSSN